MNQAIANIIKGHIQNLDFVDKIAGLTSVLTFDIKGKDNEVVQKSFPVACCVTPTECEKNGAYNDLMPNYEYKSVIYFEDGGISFEKAESNWKYYKSTLRLVAWLNIEKLTESGICKSEIPCTYAAHIITEIIRALPEFPHSHTPIERVYSEITNQLVRSPGIFSQYTYDEKHVQYLMSPFDYFALDIQTAFAICLKSTVVYSAKCFNWYLPSQDELQLIYDNLAAFGVGGFASDAYWSSTEGGTGDAYMIGFNDGYPGLVDKTSLLRIRACRSFTSTTVYAIRDIGPAGGLIFYKSGNNYLEAAPADQSAGHAWSNIVNVAIGTTLPDIGEGQNNTNEIIAQAGHTDSAAKLCDVS